MSVLLILITAIIGYSAARLYYKSVYVTRIKAIESEKGELKNQIVKPKKLKNIS
jgi:hypothetical protein